MREEGTSGGCEGARGSPSSPWTRTHFRVDFRSSRPWVVGEVGHRLKTRRGRGVRKALRDGSRERAPVNPYLSDARAVPPKGPNLCLRAPQCGVTAAPLLAPPARPSRARTRTSPGTPVQTRTRNKPSRMWTRLVPQAPAPAEAKRSATDLSRAP